MSEALRPDGAGKSDPAVAAAVGSKPALAGAGAAVASRSDAPNVVAGAPSKPDLAGAAPAMESKLDRLEPKPVVRTPNFMASRRVLPDLIEASIERGVRVVLTKAGYEIEGFYKLGPMRLEPGEKGGLVAIDRKEMVQPIESFDDLVRLNYDCWKKCRDKGAAYINPGKEWVDEFGRLNLVKRQVIFVPGDD